MREITLACEAFQKLLEEQLERIRNMNGEKTDFATKKQVAIGVIDGDGIGPVITAQATRVLEKLLAEEIAAGSVVLNDIPANCTAVGTPARVVKLDGVRVEHVQNLDQIHIPDPVAQELERLENEIKVLSEKLEAKEKENK